jgi:glycosyltransferase involved in cell wall biosynthesis
MEMNILMSLYSQFPPDVRVEKEARALLKNGHKIFLLTVGKKEDLKTEKINDINVIRVNPPTRFSIFRYIWFQLFFFNIFWRNALDSIIKQHNIDVVHVHDLPLVKTALSVTKKYKIPLIADLHENYPEAISVWQQKKMTIGNRLLSLLSPKWRWKKLEKKVLKKTNKIITVIDEAKSHYINECKIPSKDITVVMNTEDLKIFDEIKINDTVFKEYKNEFIILYIGSFYGHHRGLDTAIRSMPKILEKIFNAKLLLVGQGEIEEYLRNLSKKLHVNKNVIFTGWVDFNDIPSYIKMSDICIVPHHSSGHTNTTIPHKLFQYMALKKPIIVTNCEPLTRIIKNENCGLIIPSGNFEKMAERVIKLNIEKELAKMLGDNGRAAVEKRYNWEIEATKLCNLYQNL